MKATLKIEIEFDYKEMLERLMAWEVLSNYIFKNKSQQYNKYNNNEINHLLVAYFINTVPLSNEPAYKIKDIELTKEQNENN